MEVQVASGLGDLAPMFHKIFGADMTNLISFLQVQHPHCFWRNRFLAHWIGFVDLSNALHYDLQDSTHNFAVWVREYCTEHIDESACFLLPNYGVAIA